MEELEQFECADFVVLRVCLLSPLLVRRMLMDGSIAGYRISSDWISARTIRHHPGLHLPAASALSCTYFFVFDRVVFMSAAVSSSVANCLHGVPVLCLYFLGPQAMASSCSYGAHSPPPIHTKDFQQPTRCPLVLECVSGCWDFLSVLLPMSVRRGEWRTEPYRKRTVCA